MRMLHAVCAMILGLTACSGRKPAVVVGRPTPPLPGKTYELVVVNNFKTNIYPVLVAETFQDDLGVVGAGAEKCEGFVPFKIGWEVAITWQVASLDAPTQQVRVATAQYAAKESTIKSLQFSYQGGSNWVVTAYDGVAMGATIVEP